MRGFPGACTPNGFRNERETSRSRLGFIFVSLLLAEVVRAQTPALGPEFQVNTYTTGNQAEPTVAMRPDGGFVIAWQSNHQDGAGYGIFAQRYDQFGLSVGTEFQVNTYTTGDQYLPRAAMDTDGRFVIVWQGDSQQDNTQRHIVGRLFDSSGSPVGPDFPVSTDTTHRQARAGTAFNASGSFVVAWTNYSNDSPQFDDVRARLFDTAGNPLTDEFAVSSSTAGFQDEPSLTVAPDGTLLVAWRDAEGDAGNGEIVGRRFDGSGSPIGDQFQINTYSTGDQYRPQVGVDASGDFVVVWLSYAQDGSGGGVFGQRLASDGQPIGAEFQVNTYTTGYQGWPSLGVAGNGDFLVAWGSMAQDAHDNVVGQHFAGGGEKLGPETLINAHVPLEQTHPDVAMTAAGDFVVAWHSGHQDGGDYGVFARRSDRNATPSLSLDIHPSSGESNLNGILEPDERVLIQPTWKNTTLDTIGFTGQISGFGGPGGPSYQIVDSSADYGVVVGGLTADCYDATPSHDCYELAVSGSRPAVHWDTTVREDLTSGFSKQWTLHVGGSFADELSTDLFYPFVENVLHNGITGGCGGTSYCPGSVTLRKQMAVFVLKSKEGSSYSPPPATGIFVDVPADDPFAPWIEELYNRGIVAGCGAGPAYCPNDAVSRQQMAIFLLRTLEGSAYTPPACAGVFEDVPCPSLFADWIEDLFARGVTGGCSASPLLYCPGNSVTRGQMSPFLVKTFGLVLYGS